MLLFSIMPYFITIINVFREKISSQIYLQKLFTTYQENQLDTDFYLYFYSSSDFNSKTRWSLHYILMMSMQNNSEFANTFELDYDISLEEIQNIPEEEVKEQDSPLSAPITRFIPKSDQKASNKSKYFILIFVLIGTIYAAIFIDIPKSLAFLESKSIQLRGKISTSLLQEARSENQVQENIDGIAKPETKEETKEQKKEQIKGEQEAIKDSIEPLPNRPDTKKTVLKGKSQNIDEKKSKNAEINRHIEK